MPDTNRHIHHAPRPADSEALPAHFEQDLRQIDALVARASRVRMPAGMVDRVFSASAPLLRPAPPASLPLVTTTGAARPVNWMSRLAMAAVVALVCSISLQFLSVPESPPREVERLLVMGRSADGSPALDALMDTGSFADSEVGVLLDMRDLDIGRLHGELSQLESALEM